MCHSCYWPILPKLFERTTLLSFLVDKEIGYLVLSFPTFIHFPTSHMTFRVSQIHCPFVLDFTFRLHNLCQYLTKGITSNGKLSLYILFLAPERSLVFLEPCAVHFPNKYWRQSEITVLDPFSLGVPAAPPH